jgi:hypothetical protein
MKGEINVNDITFNNISIDSHYITEMYIRPFQEFHFYQEDGESSNNGNNDGGLRPIWGLKENQGGLWNSYGVLPTDFNSNPRISSLAQ